MNGINGMGTSAVSMDYSSLKMAKPGSKGEMSYGAQSMYDEIKKMVSSVPNAELTLDTTKKPESKPGELQIHMHGMKSVECTPTGIYHTFVIDTDTLERMAQDEEYRKEVMDSFQKSIETAYDNLKQPNPLAANKSKEQDAKVYIDFWNTDKNGKYVNKPIYSQPMQSVIAKYIGE